MLNSNTSDGRKIEKEKRCKEEGLRETQTQRDRVQSKILNNFLCECGGGC